MININSAIKEYFGYFSPTRLKSAYRLPNMYRASNIADFLNNKDSVEATADKLFVEKSYVGTAAIVFHNCTFEQQREPLSSQQLNWLWYQDLGFLRLLEKLGSSSSERQEKISQMVTAYHNGSISDPTGQLPLFSSFPIADGTKFNRSWMLYRPSLGLYRLQSYYFDAPSMKQPADVLESIVSAVPELSIA